MTAMQCQTCAKPTKHCQDQQFKHLMAATCWNYIPNKEDSHDAN